MQFEYDPDKSQRNEAKHGINFEEAQVIVEGYLSGRDSGSISYRAKIYDYWYDPRRALVSYCD